MLPADLSSADAAAGLASAAIDRLGSVDVLVNNAGTALGVGPTPLLTPAVFDELFAVNVRSSLLLAGLLGDHMGRRGGGSIVNIASVVATIGSSYTALYTATKGALESITRALAAEWGPAGVRINTVNPGIVDTDMGAFVTSDSSSLEYYQQQVPLGRVGQPDEIADLVTFLVSPAGGYITGQTFVIDGGWSTTKTVLPTAG